MCKLAFVSVCVCTYFILCRGYGESCTTGGLTIPLNEEKQDPESCTLYKCLKDAGRVVLNTLTCAPQEPRSGCRNVDSPVELPFPDCCPLVVCNAPVYGGK
uniref:Toxin protein n=1 Tax=Hemiscorpius lepturus TaxID=520031 RepID=A0A1L4BJ54_HEMLE|nr:toxin protein [Hemiscorpius lepturus]